MEVEFTVDNPKAYFGRPVLIEKQFTVPGTFQSMYAAHLWLHDNGYGYGSQDAIKPTAITIGDYYATELPHKWHNFTREQINSVAGCITGDMRDGPVFVRIFI